MNAAHIIRWTVLLSAFSIFFLSACSGDDPSSPNGGDSGKITTGEMTAVLDQSVSPGGTATVSAAGSAVDGLTLEVPAGAYPSSTTVKISYAEITAHDFGPHFHPVTPLISIENGGAFADRPMRLRIPLPDLGGAFPLAFYYDRAAGTLEPIAPVGRSDTWIDVAVRHFSEIVVSAEQIDLLRQGGGFHTLFDPKVNGWPFVNYGSWAEPGGICAGMSIGAAFFYRDFGGSPLLSSFFDNEQYWFRTPKVWQDDAAGIKFCSELQRTYVTANSFWTQAGGTPFDGFISRSDEDHFWSLCYALLAVNQPQLIYLAVKGDASAPAHAIIAYGYDVDQSEGRIRVYDPNYPGSEGIITFDFGTRAFRPYTSAANTAALEDGDTFAYDQIVFIPLSTLCDMKEIDRIWKKVGAKTIGTGQYPAYELWAVPVDNENLPRVKLLDAAAGKTTYLPYRDFTVEIVPADHSIPFSLTAWVDLPSIGEIEKHDPAGIITVERPTKDNLVGIQVNAKATGKKDFSWAGFHWFKIRLQSLWIEPADTVVGMGQDLKLVARSNGTAPPNARFEWDFGDDKTETVHGDSTVTHAFAEQGEYTVHVSMYDGGGSEAIGSAEATVQVAEFRTMMITLKGMDSTPPSTIKATGGADIPSIIWSNRLGTAPALTWNKKEFSVEYSYSQSGVDFITRISGRLADDGKSVASLSAITTGTGFGGDYTFNSAATLSAFPVDMLGSSGPMGGELSGPSAQQKIGNLSWRQTSKDAQGNVAVVELVSVDWTSQQTQLSVYFFK